MQMPEAVAAMQRLYGLGWGLRWIADELGCSRNTVKHYVHQGGWVPYRSLQRPRKLAHLELWLATSFRQHRGNADVVRQELQKEHGLRVSLRTVERAVQPWRQELDAEAQATVRFETAPGRQLQMIDFGTTTGRIGAERVTIHLFVATLGFSRRAYIQVFDHERQSAWLDGLEGPSSTLAASRRRCCWTTLGPWWSTMIPRRGSWCSTPGCWPSPAIGDFSPERVHPTGRGPRRMFHTAPLSCARTQMGGGTENRGRWGR